MEEEVKKTKADKLMEKINTLAMRIEKEKNPVTRMLYSIRAKMVIAKLDREIGLQELAEKYKNDRAKIGVENKNEKLEARSDIIWINQRINALQRQLNENSDYDYASSNFLFGSGEVEKSGGIEQYVDILKTSGRHEQVYAASQIENIENLKGELNSLQDELKQKQEELAQIDKKELQADKKIRRQETVLVVKNKFNIFTKISDVFKSIKEGIKETFAEHKKVQEVEKSAKEVKAANDAGYDKACEELKAEYDEKMQALYELYNKKQEQAERRGNRDKAKTRRDSAKTQAAQFRSQMQDLANRRSAINNPDVDMSSATDNPSIDMENSASRENVEEEREFGD